jgi:hypothetical protein
MKTAIFHKMLMKQWVKQNTFTFPFQMVEGVGLERTHEVLTRELILPMLKVMVRFQGQTLYNTGDRNLQRRLYDLSCQREEVRER